jgi:hypothetical protein
LEIYGIRPAGAARTLTDVGDIARFTDRNRFASGPAPQTASVKAGCEYGRLH